MTATPNHAPLERGVRLVSHTGDISYDEDTALPFRVHVFLRAPEFMIVTWTMLRGANEEIVARGETLAAIEDFLKRMEIETHPRFLRLTITGPGNLEINRRR